MTYQETRTGANILAGLIILIAYCLHAFNPARMATLPQGDLKPWAITMLIFIGISIVATIVIQIVFHILFSISLAVRSKIENRNRDDNEIERDIERNIKSEMVEDERDRMVDLKSTRIGFIVAGAGFMSALLSLVFNASPVVMLNIMYVSFFTGSLLEGLGRIYYYRKGG